MNKYSILLLLLLATYTNLFSQIKSGFKVSLMDSLSISVQRADLMCHSSSILELSEGNYLIVWFEGSYEGSSDVKIVGTIYNSTSKIKKIKVRTITKDTSFACWNPVLQRITNERIILFFKVGKNPREWNGYFMESFNNGYDWNSPRPLNSGLIGPVKNKAVFISDSILLCPSSIETLDNQWKVHLEYFNPFTYIFENQQIDNDTFGLIQPTILRYGSDSIQLLCRSRQNYIVQLWSSDNGKTWSKPSKIQLPNPNSGIDAVDWKNGYKLLVYNPLISGKDWWEGRTELRLALSKDGLNWEDIYTFERHESGEYSYPAIIVGSAGEVIVTYTFNRKAIKCITLNVHEKI